MEKNKNDFINKKPSDDTSSRELLNRRTLSRIGDLVYSAAMMTGFVKSVVCFFLVTGTLSARPARADNKTAASRLKVVVVLKPDDELAATTEVLKGHLADLPVTFTVITPETLPPDYLSLSNFFQTLASEHHARIVFLAQFTAPDSATLYVALPDTGTTLVRHIALTAESPEGRYELIAVIIRGIVTAMTSGGEIGVHIPEVPKPNTPPEEPAPTEAPPPSQPSPTGAVFTDLPSKRSRFTFRAGYGLSIASLDFPMVHQARLGVAGTFGPLVTFLAYRLVVPFVNTDAYLTLYLSPHPIELGLGIQKSFGDFDVQITLAPVVNILSWEIATNNVGATARKQRRTFWVALSPSLIVDWRLTYQMSLYIGISADIYVYQTVFEIQQDDDKRPYLSLWKASPLFQLGLRFGWGR